MIQPKISVVTVCYNAVNDIEKTILSVINQTYSNIEYLIIDGGSTDGTMDIVNKYKDKIDVIVSEPDKGIYDAMNKGIDRATGDWINFMNAGDYFYKKNCINDIFNKSIDANIAMVIGDSALFLDGKYYQIKCKPFYERLPLHQEMGFTHQSSFVRSNLAKHIKFNLKYKYAADYNMVIELYRMGYGFYNTNNLIAFYDMNGISFNHKLDHIKETYMIDNPTGKKINKFLSYKKYIIHLLKIYLKKILYTINPALLNMYRGSNPEYILI